MNVEDYLIFGLEKSLIMLFCVVPVHHLRERPLCMLHFITSVNYLQLPNIVVCSTELKYQLIPRVSHSETVFFLIYYLCRNGHIHSWYVILNTYCEYKTMYSTLTSELNRLISCLVFCSNFECQMEDWPFP
jgi:hypothetical protein